VRIPAPFPQVSEQKTSIASLLLSYVCLILAGWLKIMTGPAAGRLLRARLPGIALRHARWGGLTAAGKAAGTAELTEVAGDRGDLLAQVAGLMLGSATGKGPEYEARGQAVAELCRMAGADEALILQWAEEGRRRPGPLSCRRSAGQVVHHAGPEHVRPRGPAARAQAAPCAYAATISNGLCDHTRATPRPDTTLPATEATSRFGCHGRTCTLKPLVAVTFAG
jgi:hypothetical protein